MPKNIPQTLDLFPVDVTSTTLEAVLPPRDIDRFRHSTKLPGGFFELSFVLAATQDIYWMWHTKRMLFRLKLVEHGGQVIWEGRLEDLFLENFWTIRLIFRGYWSNFRDAIPDAAFSPAATGDSILQTLRDTHMNASTLQLSTSNAQMEAPGVTLNLDYNLKGEELNVWEIITNRTKGLLTFGNSSDQKMDLSVLEDRVIHYKARNPTAVTWEVYLTGPNAGLRSLPVNISWQRVFNNVLAVFESTGTVTRTAYSEDTASSAKYILKDGHIKNMIESDSTTALAARDTLLALAKDFQQQANDFQVNRLFDVNGVEWPLCRVRAGDVIRVPDFIPKTVDLDTLTLDAFSTFFVEETTCDHERGVLTIRPDRDGTSLTALLARNEIVR